MSSIILDNDDAPFTYVKESSVEGFGLFAAGSIRKGDLVIDYAMFPKDWYKTRYINLSEQQILKNWYVMLDDEDCITSDKYSKFSYINHSRIPNCTWEIKIRKIIANKDISRDEELFIDYRIAPRPSGVPLPEWI